MTPAVVSRTLIVSTHLLGVLAFMYPFFLPQQGTDERFAHAADAPILFSLFGALLIAIAATQVRAGSMGAKEIALLGVLAGMNAVLRMPGSFGGASLMFALPVLCGYAFGARFGFLLGASSFAASAVITGGIGPWLPFQMWALGWIGGGAALLRIPFGRPNRRAIVVVALAIYAWLAGYVFGVLTNLWFWPFQAGEGPLAWRPGLGIDEAAEHYRRFYLATSLAWDSARALGNAMLVVVLGHPVLRLLMRAHDTLHVTWSASVVPEERTAVPVAAAR